MDPTLFGVEAFHNAFLLFAVHTSDLPCWHQEQAGGSFGQINDSVHENCVELQVDCITKITLPIKFQFQAEESGFTSSTSGTDLNFAVRWTKIMPAIVKHQKKDLV